MTTKFDLVVIGSGPAGEKGAAQAAYFGKKVAIIERAPTIGGTGINTGTIPSKTLRETALYFSGLRQRGLYGIDYSLRENVTIKEFMYHRNRVVETEWKIVHANIARHNIDLIWGEASFRDPHTLRVQHDAAPAAEVSADVILIATGSSPFHPPGIDFDGRLICDSDSILEIERIPAAMIVVGGGVIGCEYASIFGALGTRVTLVDGRDRLLPFVDGEIADRLRERLEHIGVSFRLGERLERVARLGSEVSVDLSGGESLRADLLLMAAGRQSNVEALRLQEVGVHLGPRGLVLTNEKYQTSVDHIYAAGDVIGFPALASTSMEQARVAMVHAFGLKYKERISPILPFAIYTIPEIGCVGLTTEECQEKKVPYQLGIASYGNNARGQIIGDVHGLVKIVFNPQTLELYGVHILGESASELIHIGSNIMALGGNLKTFIDVVYNYPTLGECYKYAAYDGLGKLRERPSDSSGH
jgi:NAD(P) transhydrogenase